ncbi:MAG: hypothetical protein QW514_06035 [Thermoprotei archaeon]
MRTYERLLIIIVCVVLTVYIASYAYLNNTKPTYQLDIGVLIPPKIGIATYTGGSLNITEFLAVIRVYAGSTYTLDLTTQFIEVPIMGAQAGFDSCIYTYTKGQLLIGPCYTQTTVSDFAGKTVVVTFYTPMFGSTRIVEGYYSVLYSQPHKLGYYCAQHPSIYVNRTLILNTTTYACVLIQIIQSSYVYLPR